MMYRVPLPFLKPACSSGSSLLDVWLQSPLKDLQQNLTSMRYERHCSIIAAVHGVSFLGYGNKHRSCPVFWPFSCFPYLLTQCCNGFYGCFRRLDTLYWYVVTSWHLVTGQGFDGCNDFINKVFNNTLLHALFHFGI